jgi:hypothetical protein
MVNRNLEIKGAGRKFLIHTLRALREAYNFLFDSHIIQMNGFKDIQIKRTEDADYILPGLPQPYEPRNDTPPPYRCNKALAAS